MAMPTYTPVQVNFSGSNTAASNAQNGFATAGKLADMVVDNYRKEKDSEEAKRQFDVKASYPA